MKENIADAAYNPLSIRDDYYISYYIEDDAEREAYERYLVIWRKNQSSAAEPKTLDKLLFSGNVG